MLLEAGRKPSWAETLRAALRIWLVADSIEASVKTCAGALMLRAAMLVLLESKMGAATQRRPTTPSSLSMA